MKQLMLLLLLLFFASTTFSQNKWTRIINSPGNLEEYSNSICLDSLGNLYSTGVQENPLPKNHSIKLSSSGNILWQNSNIRGFANAVVCKNNNSILVAGQASDSAYILNFDSQGNLLHKYTYTVNESDLIQVYNMVKTSNNKYLLCGRINYTNGYAALVNEDFTIAWQKIIEGTENPEDWRVIQSGVYFNGYYYFCDSWNSLPYLTKVSPVGDIIWDKPIMYQGTYSYVNGTKLEVLNGKLLLAGYTNDTIPGNNFFITAFEQIDENGFATSKKIIYTQNSDVLRDFQIKNNRIVYTATVYNSTGNNPTGSSINVLDTNFNLIRTKKILINDYTWLNSVQISDSFYYFSGRTWKNSGANQSSDVLIIKTDSTLEIPPVGIKDENIVINNFTLHQNYPNPFNPSTKISYSLKKSSAIELKLFDINGRMIKIIESGFKPAGSYEINFSAEGLSSGVYFFSLYSEEILMDTKKAVVMK